MKKTELFLATLLGSCVCFLVSVALSILFEKWHLFNDQPGSFKSKI